jgi:2-oxoglutarate ferredoxin oxidoreductase subunit beta
MDTALTDTSHLDTACTPTWCPGCGDFGIFGAFKKALVEMGLGPNDFMVVYGIGCHGHMVNFLHAYGFEGLHGRDMPVAIGAALANPKLKIFVVAGDGNEYGEGLNHFIAGVRGNHNITTIIHNNMVYGLTTGQTSPTTAQGTKTKSTPDGVLEMPINPLALALTLGGTFVARGFAGDMHHLKELIIAGANHDGFSLIDVMQPCVTFNHTNTYTWYRERIYKLQEEGWETNNRVQSWQKALEWGDRIPTGIFYQESSPSYEDQVKQDQIPLVKQSLSDINLAPLLNKYK